ncbi:Nuclear GTPase SLIP-GC, partial [Anabarilius grahami]
SFSLNTEKTIIEQTKDIMTRVDKKIQAMKNEDETKTELHNYIVAESNEENQNLTNDTREKITALYGANAERRTFEDLKNDDKLAEMTNHFSSSNKLRDCSSVWILSDINRAVTSKDTWEILKYCTKDMMQAGECRDIHFICTKSDNIEPEEYNRLKFCKWSIEIPKLQDVLKNMNKRINQEMTRGCVAEAKAVISLIQSKTMAETEVHNVLERSLEKALDKIDCQFDMLQRLLSQSLSNGVEKSELSCRDSAEEIISPYLPEGHGGFHKILQALCINGGRHRSKAWDTVLDLNECLTKHMYENIDVEFNSIFPISAKTGFSVQELIDKFSIISSDSVHASSPMLNFIKAQEENQKKTLKEEVVNRKKKIYTSIHDTIKTAMAPYYEVTHAETLRVKIYHTPIRTINREIKEPESVHSVLEQWIQRDVIEKVEDTREEEDEQERLPRLMNVPVGYTVVG